MRALVELLVPGTTDLARRIGMAATIDKLADVVQKAISDAVTFRHQPIVLQLVDKEAVAGDGDYHEVQSAPPPTTASPGGGAALSTISTTTLTIVYADTPATFQPVTTTTAAGTTITTSVIRIKLPRKAAVKVRAADSDNNTLFEADEPVKELPLCDPVQDTGPSMLEQLATAFQGWQDDEKKEKKEEKEQEEEEEKRSGEEDDDEGEVKKGYNEWTEKGKRLALFPTVDEAEDDLQNAKAQKAPDDVPASDFDARTRDGVSEQEVMDMETIIRQMIDAGELSDDPDTDDVETKAKEIDNLERPADAWTAQLLEDGGDPAEEPSAEGEKEEEYNLGDLAAPGSNQQNEKTDDDDDGDREEDDASDTDVVPDLISNEGSQSLDEFRRRIQEAILHISNSVGGNNGQVQDEVDKRDLPVFGLDSKIVEFIDQPTDSDKMQVDENNSPDSARDVIPDVQLDEKMIDKSDTDAFGGEHFLGVGPSRYTDGTVPNSIQDDVPIHKKAAKTIEKTLEDLKVDDNAREFIGSGEDQQGSDAANQETKSVNKGQNDDNSEEIVPLGLLFPSLQPMKLIDDDEHNRSDRVVENGRPQVFNGNEPIGDGPKKKKQQSKVHLEHFGNGALDDFFKDLLEEEDDPAADWGKVVRKPKADANGGEEVSRKSSSSFDNEFGDLFAKVFNNNEPLPENAFGKVYNNEEPLPKK